MNLVALFLACIIAGFALTALPPVAFLSSFGSFFDIIGVVAMIIFSFVLLYMGVKSLSKGI